MGIEEAVFDLQHSLTPPETTEQFICQEVRMFKWHGELGND